MPNKVKCYNYWSQIASEEDEYLRDDRPERFLSQVAALIRARVTNDKLRTWRRISAVGFSGL